MLLAHISDTHFRSRGEKLYGFIDVNAANADVVSQLNALRERPDAVVVSGDIVNCGRPEEYQVARQILGSLNYPLYLIPKLFGPMNNNWLGRSNSALLALALIGVWKFAGYYMLFFLAGLQSIPASTREAALMEGATRTQVFFKVTLPLLRPTLSFVITTALIYSITQIDHVAVMTRGGPDNATTVLLYYIQNLAWDTHDLGKASAATFLTLAGLFAFSLINLKLLEKGAHYER
ncbi:N-Acetyl-D-glucosamine ABC transport system, permease protein [Klebsiella pneumoniae]|nr:N-Acetyl-D-glucosamine ABC transport system, permease protein [Klebsiella pneumoniae]